MPVVRLQTVDLSSSVVSAGKRPHKKRVFTEDEWKFLHTRDNADLLRRIGQGHRLIKMLGNPAMLNMTQASAAYYQSNLRFQIDAIWRILESRGVERNG